MKKRRNYETTEDTEEIISKEVRRQESEFRRKKLK
jgi:hypothetical protein